MLNLTQIKTFYSGKEKFLERNLLREYLQYLILEKIFNFNKANKLNFMGGTALRICYGHDRFSQDLDFDNFGLNKNDFEALAFFLKKELEKEGLTVSVRNVFKKAFRCYLKISSLLYNFGLSPLKEEKILVQIDTTRQNFKIKPDFYLLNKFGIFKEIRLNPKDILLSQKIGAFLFRKRAKGRDIYDLVYLSSFTTPNFNYLFTKYNLKNKRELKLSLEKRVKKINLKSLTRDVEPFLINKEKVEIILKFPDWLKNYVIP